MAYAAIAWRGPSMRDPRLSRSLNAWTSAGTNRSVVVKACVVVGRNLVDRRSGNGSAHAALSAGGNNVVVGGDDDCGWHVDCTDPGSGVEASDRPGRLERWRASRVGGGFSRELAERAQEARTAAA